MTQESPSFVRFGKVSSYDEKKIRAKVFFPEIGMLSDWLPLITMNTLKNQDEWHVDEGEDVVCLMCGNGSERGIILGSYYTDKNLPKIGDKNKRVTTFEDGTVIEQDRAEGKISIKTGSIDETANVSINGNETVSGNVSVGGNISAGGTIIDAAGNTNHHAH